MFDIFTKNAKAIESLQQTINKLSHDLSSIQYQYDDTKRIVAEQADLISQQNRDLTLVTNDVTNNMTNTKHHLDIIDENSSIRIHDINNLSKSVDTLFLRVNDCQSTIEKQSQIIKEFQIRDEETQKYLSLVKEIQRKRTSNEPWIEVVGESLTEDGQISLRMDWNEAFIDSLRATGYIGTSDDMVATWLSQIKNTMDQR